MMTNVKHFLDAELAAEYQQAAADYSDAEEHGDAWFGPDIGWDGSEGSCRARLDAIERFAINSHHDEEPQS